MYFKNKMAPSKASKRARFRWWWGAEAGKQVTTTKSEHKCSFSMVVGC